MKILLLILISHSVWAQKPSECRPPMSREDFFRLVDDVRNRYFPELREIDLKITTFRSQNSFLQVQPVMSSLFGQKSRRRYTLQLNLKLLECPPHSEALGAILVHELSHIRDYTELSSAQILGLGIKYLSSSKFRASYERSTDYQVLDFGLHEGLAQYREWLYPRLSPKELLKKRKNYLTPEEIRQAL